MGGGGGGLCFVMGCVHKCVEIAQNIIIIINCGVIMVILEKREMDRTVFMAVFGGNRLVNGHQN